MTTLVEDNSVKLLPNELAAQKLEQPKYYYYSTNCKHERCSYDIMNCGECIRFSLETCKNREAAEKAEEVKVLSLDPAPKT